MSRPTPALDVSPCLQGVKDTILANQLRHRLHDMEHDMPHMSGSIRDTLTHISLKDSSFPSSADQV